MKVRYKITGEESEVYGINYDSVTKTTHFLVYWYNTWFWINADDTEPILKICKENYSITHNKDYWVTVKDEIIYPRQMTEGHLKNTIKLIKKLCKNNNWNPTDYKIYNLLVEELSTRNK